MSYAVVQDVAASWERYEAIRKELVDPPNGLILHVAGPTEEGFRIIEVWESEEACARFARQASLDALDTLAPPVRRTLRPSSVVFGAEARTR